jgi:hypothetical protein
MIQVYDRIRVKRVCKHEAGHIIVAKHLGFTTNGISVRFLRNGGHSGEGVIEPWTPDIYNFEDLKTYLKRRIYVLYAGVISESFDENDKYDSDYAINEWRNGGGKDDYSKVRELTQVIRNITNPKTNSSENIQPELDIIDGENIQQAGKLVSESLNKIDLISSKLESKVSQYNITYSLSETEIESILKTN